MVVWWGEWCLCWYLYVYVRVLDVWGWLGLFHTLKLRSLGSLKLVICPEYFVQNADSPDFVALGVPYRILGEVSYSI